MSPNSYTWRDFDKQHLDWCKRRILAPFREAAKGQPWEADATKFMEEALAIWSVISKHQKAPPDVIERGRNLISRDCNDPLVRYFTLWLRRARSDEVPRPAFDDYEKVLQELEADRRYPRAMTRFVAISLTEARLANKKATNKNARDHELYLKMTQWTREALEEGSYSGADDMILVQHILNPRWIHHYNYNFTKLAEVLASSTQLSAWAKHTLMGYIEMGLAALDHAKAYTAPPEKKDWKGFFEHSRKACAELERSWQLRPDRPEAAAEMMWVLTPGQPGPRVDRSDSPRLWFERAVKAQFDYLPAYDNYDITLGRDLEHQHDALLAFGRACIATKRYDTHVPDHFFEVVRKLGTGRKDKRVVYRNPVIADEVMALEKALLAAPERKSEIADRLSSVVLHGWLCGRYEEARKALDQLGGKLSRLDGRLVRTLHIGTDFLAAEVIIFASVAKEDFEKARQFARARDYPSAVQFFQSALKKVGEDPRAQEQIQIEMTATKGEEELSKGGWVSVPTKAGRVGFHWLVVRGPLLAPAEDVLQIGVGDMAALAVSRMRVGPNFEVRADFEPHPREGSCHFLGVAVAYSKTEEDFRLEDDSWIMCMVEKHGDEAASGVVLRKFEDAGNPKVPVTLERRNHVHVQCWNNRITYYFNGKRVFNDFEPKRGLVENPNSKFGFGACGSHDRSSTRISNIQVRLLKEPPLPPDGIPSSQKPEPAQEAETIVPAKKIEKEFAFRDATNPYRLDGKLEVLRKAATLKQRAALPPGSDLPQVITVGPGVEIRGGRIELHYNGSLIVEGTPDKPAILRNVVIGQDNNPVGLKAKHAVFDQCTFWKSGPWHSHYSSKWAFDSCLLDRCTFSSLDAVYYGIKLERCAFVSMAFPEIQHRRQKGHRFDHIESLRGEWNTISGCQFVDCKIPPTVAWSGRQSNYMGCKFIAGETFESDTPTEVTAFVADVEANLPHEIWRSDPARAPLKVVYASTPFPTVAFPFLAASNSPTPTITEDARLSGWLVSKTAASGTGVAKGTITVPVSPGQSHASSQTTGRKQ